MRFSKQLEESFTGLAKIPFNRLAKYTFENNLKCMELNFFNVSEIKKALISLVRLNSGISYRFMNSSILRTNSHSTEAPSPHNPSFISEEYFEKALKQDKDVEVVFDSISFRIVDASFESKKKWFDPLYYEFLPGVKNSPAGANVRCFYSKGEKERAIVRDNLVLGENGESVYQIFLDLFGNALRGFSCFVGDPSIELNSSRYLEDGMESFRKGVGRWKGSLENFIKSAGTIEKTIGSMKNTGNYKITKPYANETRIMLNHPDFGVILMTDRTPKYYDSFWKEKEQKGFKSKWVDLPTTFVFSKKALELMESDKSLTRIRY